MSIQKKIIRENSPSVLEFKILREIHNRSEKGLASFQMADLCESVNTTLGGVKNALNSLKKKLLIKSKGFLPGVKGKCFYTITDSGMTALLKGIDKPRSKFVKNKKEKNEKIQGYVYLIQDLSTNHLKIGYTEKSPLHRIKGLQTGNPSELKLITFLKGSMRAEKILHKKFKKYHHNLEWFKYNDEIVDYLMNENNRFLIEMLTA